MSLTARPPYKVTDGYDCSADIFAADLFQTAFAIDPRSQASWERFRRSILEQGGSLNELEMIKSFLGGRLPNIEALLSMLDLPPLSS